MPNRSLMYSNGYCGDSEGGLIKVDYSTIYIYRG